MISTTIRAWNVEQNRHPCVFLYQNTPTGVFSITDVEAEITEKLLPLEQLCLRITKTLGAITRVEIHAISGIGLDICDDTLHSLQFHGLLKLQEYDQKKLFENIEIVSSEIGSDWQTPFIDNICQRTLLKQYVLSKEGEGAVQSLTKTVRQNRDLNIILTGKPFYLFLDKFDLKSDGFEMVTMDRNLIKNILGHAERFADYTGVKPLSIGSNTVTEGKEVSNSQFWITIDGMPDQHIDDAKYQLYLSSQSFERWANPSWNKYLLSLVKSLGFEYVKDIVISAMSETWMMVEDVIEEGLKLADDQITWTLETDLEMQKLIYNVMPDPIRQIKAELKLRLPDSPWKVVVMVQLEPWDDLGMRSLRAGRFHQIAPRKGFTRDEGFLDYSEMMQEWGKKVERAEYLDVLETLVEYNCLIERLPKIDEVVVDVDDVLKENRRERQKWQFNRLREIDHMLEQNKIQTIRYIAGPNTQTKVDEADELENWISDGKLEIVDGNKQPVPEPLRIARETKAHYIGNKKMQKNNKSQEYGRRLEFYVTKKQLHIPGLEPFYDWRQENIFEKLYDVYYE